jgi:hypothetical protein
VALPLFCAAKCRMPLFIGAMRRFD